ncbi:MAG TPA: YdeI/OmpD-associated family protein [Pyrinomonadaceae bacterium]|jgi:hypothetical protein
MPKVQFSVQLKAGEQGSVYFVLPKRESAKFGVRGRVPVTGTINDYPFRSSIFPMGDGTHYMAVNRAVREGARVAAGDRVRVSMETDTAERVVTIPPDLDRALAKSKQARARFDKLSYTHRKEHAGWIESAKRPETRARRIEQVLSKLAIEKG